MKKLEIRAYINLRNKMAIDGRTIHSELVTSLGGSAPSLRTVYRWIQHSKTREGVVEDMQRVGRPRTGISPPNVDQVHRLIEENPQISLDHLQERTKLCRGTLVNIIHHQLKMRKLLARWIPHDLNPTQKLKRLEYCKKNLKLFDEGQMRLCDIVTGDESWIYHRKIQKKSLNKEWVGPDGTPGTVVKRNQFEKKSMICVFFKSNGHVLVDVLEANKTINNIYYIDKCLKPMIRALKSQRPVSGLSKIRLLHDNARPHVHSNVRNFLQKKGIKLIDHPPYSPDLAPSDFWLFDEIKRRLPSQMTANNVDREVTKILESIPAKEFLKTFEKYIERMRLCVTAEGDYFEHLIK